jgi:hypothetical protein
MLTPFRPAVFACPMRYMHGEKPKSGAPPPDPAWPELADPSTFYTLPTLCSLPNIAEAMYHSLDSHWGWDEDAALGEQIREMLPEIEAYLPQLQEMLPDLEGEIQHLAKMADVSPNYDLLFYAMTLASYKDIRIFSRGVARSLRVRGSDDPDWDTFAFFHDIGHYTSLRIGRATTEKVTSLASALFNLLKPASVAQCTNFWDEFQENNDALLGYLDKALVLEELRANVFAFSQLDSNIRSSIEPDLRKGMERTGTISLFDGLIALKEVRQAVGLTILAEVSDPEDPIRGISALMRLTNWLEEFNWRISDEHMKSGYHLEFDGSMNGGIQITTKMSIGDRAVEYWSLPADIQEAIFLESLRQQLAQLFGLSLVCPFQQRRRTCCGFGHYLRAVWEQVPLEYRYAKSVIHPKTGKKLFVRAPRKACLNYGLG